MRKPLWRIIGQTLFLSSSEVNSFTVEPHMVGGLKENVNPLHGIMTAP